MGRRGFKNLGFIAGFFGPSNNTNPYMVVQPAPSASSTALPLSQIEKSVTHLLVATKQLLETLTQWSRGQATDNQVSDVYVRLGYEFNMACRAFSAINVDTSDLGNVPELLRGILEATLSQEASVESLEKYLPRIRDIIINLLHGLKKKQQKLRQKQAREKENGSLESGGMARAPSTSTNASNNTGLTSLLNEGLDSNGYRGDPQAAYAGSMDSSPERRFPPRGQSRTSGNSEQSSLSSTTMQNMPVLPPYPGDETMVPSGPSGDLTNIESFPPPPPAPKQQSALAALQRGGDLERRASRRYSAYQISKHLGGPGNGVPMLPPQNTPIPNRGRGDVKESMQAVRVREAMRPPRKDSSQSRMGMDSSPARVPRRVSEEPEPMSERPRRDSDSPVAGTPEDKYPKPSATLKGPPTDMPVMGYQEQEEPVRRPARDRSGSWTTRPQTTSDKQDDSFTKEQSPPLSKELTLFLQYKSKVKKFVLPEGHSELSMGKLQLAFIEKFSWNTHNNGVDLPEIYIQDPVSGVRHELEDLSDIRDRTVLVLNVEPLDEVKKHIDDGIGTLKRMVDEVKQGLGDQGAAIERVSTQQQETAKEVARLAATPLVGPASASTSTPQSSSAANTPVTSSRRPADASNLAEVQSLRRDLAVIRQTYTAFANSIQSAMAGIRAKANDIKVAAAAASVPDSAEGGSGSAYVLRGRKQLNADSDALVNRVDDLQDMVEDLRKDVVHRGVRPLPRQLDDVTKDIAQLNKELRRVDEYIRREKPIWTRIWEKELEEVCQGRDELRVMEELMVDLRDDLEKASETFALVEQATREQMKDPAGPGGVGASSGGLSITNGSAALLGGGTSVAARSFSNRAAAAVAGLGGGGVDPSAAKESVLGEVRALQPNHEDRLEAIERAAKLRQRELELRLEDPLRRELEAFVDEGRLRKSGGIEEVERARKAKEERMRREVWERMNGVVLESPEEGAADGQNNEQKAEGGQPPNDGQAPSANGG